MHSEIYWTIINRYRKRYGVETAHCRARWATRPVIIEMDNTR